MNAILFIPIKVMYKVFKQQFNLRFNKDLLLFVFCFWQFLMVYFYYIKNPPTNTTNSFFFFFWRESFNLWRPLLMITLYHQTKTPINLRYKWGLNPRSLIQPSETLPIKLAGTHNTTNNLEEYVTIKTTKFGRVNQRFLTDSNLLEFLRYSTKQISLNPHRSFKINGLRCCHIINPLTYYFKNTKKKKKKKSRNKPRNAVSLNIRKQIDLIYF